MKIAWFILLVSAFTDGGIVAAAGFGALLTAAAALPAGEKMVWTWSVLAVPVVSGIGVAFRTIQQALKASPATSAALMGQPVVTVTQTANEIVKITPGETLVAKPKRRKP